MAPVVQGHPRVRFGVPGSWSFWKPLAREYLARCDKLVVLQIDGWREAELALARALGKLVDYIEPVGAEERCRKAQSFGVPPQYISCCFR